MRTLLGRAFVRRGLGLTCLTSQGFAIMSHHKTYNNTQLHLCRQLLQAEEG